MMLRDQASCIADGVQCTFIRLSDVDVSDESDVDVSDEPDGVDVSWNLLSLQKAAHSMPLVFSLLFSPMPLLVLSEIHLQNQSVAGSVIIMWRFMSLSTLWIENKQLFGIVAKS